MQILKSLARAAGALALMLTSGCAVADADPQVTAERPTHGPALWKLAEADTTIYLFGTVHALPSDVDWYDGHIAAAFEESDELVTEIAMDDQLALTQALTGSAMLADGQNLREMMTPEDRKEYEQAMIDLGLPPGALDPVEPWYAAMNLSVLPLVQAGIDPAAGVDMTLTRAGANKRKDALETLDEQVALFDDMPVSAQLTFLDATVDAVPEAAKSLRELIDLWVVGDAVGLAAKMNEGLEDPALHQRLLTDRNTNWAGWIEHRLAQPGTVFIAVGAGHLAGDGSVQEQLSKRGYKVERVH
ncbi:TraB/GumN family protein [Aurantiacibacter suaedae]|uniref:TraB/GumN family protein n=1 Tax=Aurantiacibacter suaedae TaxID=2545755 RepID=UPI0010F8CA95|nr:TraB/GumN family protein [Aurantiacibacter suaedae]